MPPSSLLFAHSSDELYGSDIVLLELTRRLDPARFRPLVVTPTDLPYRGQLSRALHESDIRHQAMDIPVLRRRYLSPLGLPAFLRRLATGPRRLQHLAAAENIALIHSNTGAVWGGALAARRAALPHLWHIHEIVTRPASVRRLIAWMIAHYSDQVVAISRAVADHLLADQPDLSSRLVVIPDAVDADRFHPDIDGTDLRTKWRLAPDQTLIGVVGRISAWKGQDFFLRAFAQALTSAPQLRGVLVGVLVGDVVPGEDQRRHDLQRLAADLGIADHIIWAGYRSDTPQIMAALDILVLPSLLPEPFGMVALEAMAAGKPVLATAHGGPLETIRDGETGYLVSPTDPHPLADALARLASDPPLRAQLGAHARVHVCRSFGFDAHVAAFQDLYEHLLASPRPLLANAPTRRRDPASL